MKGNNTKTKQDCVFCRIVNKEQEEEILYEDEDIIAFPDYKPRTPVHVMIATKKHFNEFENLMHESPELLTNIGLVVEKLVEELQIKGKPYTWGFHCGGKQSVHHVHAGLLSGMEEDELVL